MKKYLFVICCTVLLFTACSQVEIEPYDGVPYVSLYSSEGFYRKCVQEIETNFYYMDDKVTRDTVWLKIVAKAALPTKDYHVKIRAYSDTISTTLLNWKDGESGIHYVPFDDESLTDEMVLHAGNMYDSIPVVLLRDPSLKEAGRRITIRMDNSDDIQSIDQRADDDDEHIYAVIYTSDCLSQPSNWYNYSWFFLGTYGLVKHQFIIEHSGERWDYDFINNLDTYDQTYYQYKFRNELEEVNKERLAQGLSVLSEANGDPVEFPAD